MHDHALWLPVCGFLLLEIGTARFWNAGPDIDFRIAVLSEKEKGIGLKDVYVRSLQLTC